MVITVSVTINLVMLGVVGYLAALNHHNENTYSAMNVPIVVYLPKAMVSSDIKTSMTPQATQ